MSSRRSLSKTGDRYQTSFALRWRTSRPSSGENTAAERLKEQNRMSQYTGDNQTHKGNVSTAEGVRQVAVTAAGTQAAALAAELVFYRACIASAKTNSVSTDVYQQALRSLGVWS
jgi:hypothetical protein